MNMSGRHMFLICCYRQCALRVTFEGSWPTWCMTWVVGVGGCVYKFQFHPDQGHRCVMYVCVYVCVCTHWCQAPGYPTTALSVPGTAESIPPPPPPLEPSRSPICLCTTGLGLTQTCKWGPWKNVDFPYHGWYSLDLTNRKWMNFDWLRPIDAKHAFWYMITWTVSNLRSVWVIIPSFDSPCHIHIK